MATTSGAYNTQTYTAAQTITQALRRLRVLAAGASAGVNDLADGQVELNYLLKDFEIMGAELWLKEWVEIPLIPNQFQYSIGPGGDVDPGWRPLRAFEDSYRRTTCDGGCTDIQLNLLSRQEYAQFSTKCQPGTPTSFYYDPQMGDGGYDPANSCGQLYFWQAPTDLSISAFIDFQRPIQDITDTGETFDLPLEWYRALVDQLAVRMADYFEVPEDRLTRLIRMAQDSLEKVEAWSATEQAPTFFQPSYQFAGVGRNNY